MSKAPEANTAESAARRVPIIVAIVGISLVIAGAVTFVSGGEEPTPIIARPSATTPPPSTSTPSLRPATTQPPSAGSLTERFSPFLRDDALSATRRIPDSALDTEAAASVFVDPDLGDDSNPGSFDSPVAGLEAARDIARDSLRSQSGDVVVYLRGGIHARTEPFRLSFQDGGRGDQQMVYRSYPGEQAIVDGGVPIGGWEPAFDAVLVAGVPDGVADVRQFYASGERQQRARTPTAVGSAVEFVAGPLYGGQRNVAMTVDSALVAGMSHPEDLELVYIGVLIARRPDSDLRPSWKAHRLPVDGYTDLGDGTTLLQIGNGALYQASERGYPPLEVEPEDPFFLENSLELLDEPGEWYFDRHERLLYWWPRDPSHVEDAWLPVADSLLEIDGTPGRPVRNLSVEGIAFRHSGYLRPNTDGYVVSQADTWFTGWETPAWMQEDGERHSFLDRARPSGLPGAAVHIDSVADVTFTRNVFCHLGAIGVLVHNDARRVSFNGNVFFDISAGALVAGHPAHDEIDEPMEGAIVDLGFTNNVIDRAAAEYYASAGVLIFKSTGAEINHNLFRNLPYTALSLGWGWEDNLSSTVHRAIAVEGNYFENVVTMLYDGAPIYLLGPVADVGARRSDFVQIRGNFANNSDAPPQFRAATDQVDPEFAKRPGVQIDNGSRNVVVVDNVFAGASTWLQVTAWLAHRDDAGWVDELALIARRNWSDTLDSFPPNLTLVGGSGASLLDPADVDPDALEIMVSAGLEDDVALPPLP